MQLFKNACLWSRNLLLYNAKLSLLHSGHCMQRSTQDRGRDGLGEEDIVRSRIKSVFSSDLSRHCLSCICWQEIYELGSGPQHWWPPTRSTRVTTRSTTTVSLTPFLHTDLGSAQRWATGFDCFHLKNSFFLRPGGRQHRRSLFLFTVKSIPISSCASWPRSTVPTRRAHQFLSTQRRCSALPFSSRPSTRLNRTRGLS